MHFREDHPPLACERGGDIEGYCSRADTTFTPHEREDLATLARRGRGRGRRRGIGSVRYRGQHSKKIRFTAITDQEIRCALPFRGFAETLVSGGADDDDRCAF